MTLFKRCIVAASLLTFLLPLTASALDGGYHEGYMWRIFPFEENPQDTTTYQTVKTLYKLINTYIDKPDGEATADYPAFVVEESYYRAMHIANYNHRIWFHWGFRTDPKDYEPLRNAIDVLVAKKIMTEQDRVLFWLQLNNDNESKKRVILDFIAMNVFGYNNYGGLQYESQIKQIEAIASILCTIHYIGDLIPEYNTRTDLVPSLDKLKQWLYEDINDIAGEYGNNSVLASELINSLDSINEPEPLLHKLEDDFGKFMISLEGWPYSYQETFTSMGFTLREYEEG